MVLPPRGMTWDGWDSNLTVYHNHSDVPTTDVFILCYFLLDFVFENVSRLKMINYTTYARCRTELVHVSLSWWHAVGILWVGVLLK